jgi:putative ABC transport system permease protein
LGAYRSSVITQLVGESLITTLIAMIIALVLVKLLLPFFTLLSGAIIDSTTLLQPKMIIGLIVLYLLITILSGIYPAIKMARFNPVDILKGQYVGTRQGSRLRKSLIVIQFTISLSLIIATIVIYNQLNFINKKELGYNKDNLVVLPVSDKIVSQASQFKLGLAQSGLIESATISGETPTNIQGVTILI